MTEQLRIAKPGVGTEPNVSVILTTYNRAHLIAHAIESVLAQTFSEWELLVIDDGSVDDTYSVVKPFILSDPRIRYHLATNRGLSIARNIGIQIAVAPWITFLDSDDTYTKNHLQLRFNFLSSHPDTQLLHGGVKVIGPETVPDRNDSSKQINLRDCTIGGTFVIQRALAMSLHGFGPVDYGDDNDFFLRAQRAGASIAKVSYPTYLYNRFEPDSLCAILERESRNKTANA